MTITDFLPSTEELESGINKPLEAAPSEAEQRRMVIKIAFELGFYCPHDHVDHILAQARWDAARGMLRIGEKAAQIWLRNFANDFPEVAAPDGEARIERTLLTAHQRSDASLLSTERARRKFIARYGRERLDEITYAQHTSETQ